MHPYSTPHTYFVTSATSISLFLSSCLHWNASLLQFYRAPISIIKMMKMPFSNFLFFSFFEAEFAAHAQTINCLALGHKSSVLVTGGEDRKINLWTLCKDGYTAIMVGHWLLYSITVKLICKPSPQPHTNKKKSNLFLMGLFLSVEFIWSCVAHWSCSIWPLWRKSCYRNTIWNIQSMGFRDTER